MAAKKTPKTNYFIFFVHGKPGEIAFENMEINFSDINEITEINNVKALEQHLSKNFINPKVINFIPLRKS